MTGGIVLASASPRRLQLLEALGLLVEVRPVDIDETPRAGERAEAYVRRLAHEKLVAARATDHEVVVAADTTVELDERLFGKPASPREAVATLSTLAGRTHRVHTGLGARRGARTAVVHCVTEVEMSAMRPDDIARYVATGEPLDKAGAYGAQGVGARFIPAVRGSYANVVGLPIHLLATVLDEVGVDLDDLLPGPERR
jgi:septum formation protein